jgi:hypothetical protein
MSPPIMVSTRDPRAASKSTMNQALLIAAFLGALLSGAALPARAQDNQGPMAPPPKFEVKRIPSVPNPGPPPIPEQEIIRRFAANEDAAKKVYQTYDFTQTVRIEELGDPGGKLTVVGEEYTRPDGQRYWRATKQPESTLKAEKYSLEDVHTMMTVPLFFLTSDEIANYDLLYAGQQKLDELNAYAFQVKPKTLSRRRLLFQGIVFVDDHDLAIVETYGKFVSELSGNGAQLPFSLFEVYRENFQEKYWLPTYISSDDFIKDANGDELHLRLVIRSADFKPNALAAPASATASPPPATQPRP